MTALREWLVGLAFFRIGIVPLSCLLVGAGLILGLVICGACSPRR